MTKEQFDKLPKYAQEKINKLQNQKDTLQRHINSLVTLDPTNICIEHYYGLHQAKYLPNNSHICFWFDQERKWDYIKIYKETEGIIIRGSSFLKIIPRTSNEIQLITSLQSPSL